MEISDVANIRVISVALPTGEEGRRNPNPPITLAASIVHDILYVCDSGNHKIQCLSSNGTLIEAWGLRGLEDGTFQFPSGIAVHHSYELDKAIIWYMRHIYALNVFPPGLLPIVCAYLGYEEIYVTDRIRCCVQIFTSSGSFIRKWGKTGNQDGFICLPSACSIDNRNSIVYVVDEGERFDCPWRIQAFTSKGEYLSTACYLYHMEPIRNITIGGDGGLYFISVDKCAVNFTRPGAKRAELVYKRQDTSAMIIAISYSGSSYSGSFGDIQIYSINKYTRTVVAHTLRGEPIGLWKFHGAFGAFTGCSVVLSNTLFLVDASYHAIVAIPLASPLPIYHLLVPSENSPSTSDLQTL